MMPGFQLPSILPAAGPEFYKTYSIRGRRRRGTCEEAGCPRYEAGFRVISDEATNLGQRQAAYFRSGSSGRRFRESHEGGLTYFDFYPGQQCFAEHWVSLEVDPRFLVLGGDFRGNPRGEAPREHRNWDDWANDFGDHVNTVNRERA